MPYFGNIHISLSKPDCFLFNPFELNSPIFEFRCMIVVCSSTTPKTNNAQNLYFWVHTFSIICWQLTKLKPTNRQFLFAIIISFNLICSFSVIHYICSLEIGWLCCVLCLEFPADSWECVHGIYVQCSMFNFRVIIIVIDTCKNERELERLILMECQTVPYYMLYNVLCCDAMNWGTVKCLLTSKSNMKWICLFLHQW